MIDIHIQLSDKLVNHINIKWVSSELPSVEVSSSNKEISKISLVDLVKSKMLSSNKIIQNILLKILNKNNNNLLLILSTLIIFQQSLL